MVAGTRRCQGDQSVEEVVETSEFYIVYHHNLNINLNTASKVG